MHRFLIAAIAAVGLVFGIAEARADAFAEISRTASCALPFRSTCRRSGR